MSTKTVIISLLLLCPAILSAQSGKKVDRIKDRSSVKFEKFESRSFDRFEKFREKSAARFERFKAKANERYAAFMEKAWKDFQVRPALQKPAEPKPDIPPLYMPDDDIEIRDIPLPFDEIDIDTAPVPPVPMLIPVPDVPEITQEHSFSYYGTRCMFRADDSFRFSMDDPSATDFEGLWLTVSDGRFNNMLSDCLDGRQRLNLCDWAYVRYVQEAAEAYLGRENRDAAVFLEHFLLTQSGFKTRLAIAAEENRLALLPAFGETVFGFPYIESGNDRLYVIDRELSSDMFYVLDLAFEDECTLSVRASRPAIEYAAGPVRDFRSKAFPEASASVSTNLNLIAFYNDYPLNSNWDLYASASLSEEAKSTLYPALRNAIAGKPQREAVEILLNFVQTSLEYMTDEEQFGGERPLFPDESLYYPYCDCEDRAILFSVLVRELVGLETVLLYYPGHLASAVRFETGVPGDYLLIDGRKYTVCDPTYINAGVGMTMPDYRDVTATVVRLDPPA